MRTGTIIAAAVAAGVVGAGAVVTPVVLAAGEDPSPGRYGPRWDDDGGGGRGFGPMHENRWQETGRQLRQGMGEGMGHGMGQGMGPGRGRGQGEGPRWQDDRGSGDCLLLDGAGRGKLTSEQEGRLASQAELEKMSHDVYTAFAEQTGDFRFEHIAVSETRHLEALRTLMDRYGVDDPTEGLAAGDFSTGVKDDYEAHLESGSASSEAALDTAAEIERHDIDGLERAAEGLDAPDVERVYAHLAHASRMHLAAFTR